MSYAMAKRFWTEFVMELTTPLTSLFKPSKHGRLGRVHLLRLSTHILKS
jgi:hypothetical protein